MRPPSVTGTPKKAVASSSEEPRTPRAPTAYPGQHSGSSLALCPKRVPSEQGPETPTLPGRNRKECLQMSQVPRMRFKKKKHTHNLAQDCHSGLPLGMGNRIRPGRTRMDGRGLDEKTRPILGAPKGSTEGLRGDKWTGNSHGPQR